MRAESPPLKFHFDENFIFKSFTIDKNSEIFNICGCMNLFFFAELNFSVCIMVFIACFKKNIFCFCYIECKFIGVKPKGNSVRSLSRVLLMAVIGRNSRPEVFLGKGVLEICSKFTGEYPCRSVITIKLQSNFIEITLWHGCSPENLLFISEHLILRTSPEGYFCR